MLKFEYMSKSIKQIYASIELGENDIKLLVAEYFNTRFNILKVERATTSAISDFKVIDNKLLSKNIKELVDKASDSLGAAIEKAILVLPAYNFKRIPLKSKVVPESGYVTKKDIARAISNSLKSEVEYDVLVVNPLITKYTVNGFSTRRIPEKEPCNECIVDIDLLCADKDMTMSYVSCVENAGLKVLDICLNTYAIAKEVSLIEESLKQNIICLDIEKNCTYLSLLSNGKLITSEVVFEGYNAIAQNVRYHYNIPDNDILKLIKYDVDFDSNNLDDVIYAYNEQSTTKTITQRELNEVCEKPIDDLVDKLLMMSKPILERGAILVVTGEGEQISSLVKKIEKDSGSELKAYYPDTIGVRDPGLSAIHGSLFVYRDKALLNDLNVNCIDLLQYDSLIDQKQFDTEGETITTKIKNLFKQYIER